MAGKADSNGNIKLIALLGAMGLLAGLVHQLQEPSNMRIDANRLEIGEIDKKIAEDDKREIEDNGRVATIEKGQQGLLKSIKAEERFFLEKINSLELRINVLEQDSKTLRDTNIKLMQNNYDTQIRELTRELNRKKHTTP